MRIVVDLSDEQAAQLQRAAESLGIRPDELACAILAEWRAQPQDDLQKAAEHVLQKNKELCQKSGEALHAANRKYGNALRRLGE